MPMMILRARCLPALGLPRLSPAWGAALALSLAACAPSLDWREAHADGSEVQSLFPCRPTQVERRVMLAGQAVRMALLSCAAGAQTWGLSFADVGDPARVDAALSAQLATAASNIGAAAASAVPQAVPGATPQPRSGRVRLQGRLPDGKPIRMQLLVFARGTVVYQASVIGAELPDEAADSFLSAIRFSRP